MRSTQIIAAAVHFTLLALAFPFSDEEVEGDVQIFKRDAPLTPEDLLLAEQHNVNTTEMFKHSTIKRRGEEDITIWVDNSFIPSNGPEPDHDLSKRAVRTKHPYTYYKEGNRPIQCFRPTHHSDTGPTAPCTGGIKEMRSWARNNGGYFTFAAATTAWRTILVAGSNSGCNGRVRVQRDRALNYSRSPQMGNIDLHNLINKSLSKFSKWYNGRQRMRAHGKAECGEYQTRLNWQITNWDEKV